MFGSPNYNFPMNNGYTTWYQQPQSQEQQTNVSVVFIQGGDATANNYLIAPNQMVVLIDNELGKVYIKSSDASGRLMPLRKFDEEKPTPPKTPDFVTREEFEKRLKELTNVSAAE